MRVLAARGFLVLFLASSVLIGRPAWAQNGTISGTVTGSGAALSGVTVTATNNLTNAKTSTVTDASGAYSLSLAPTTHGDVYLLNTSNTQGYVDQVYNGLLCSGVCFPFAAPTPISVAPGAVITANFSLTPDTPAHIVGTVTSGGAPLVDVSVRATNVFTLAAVVVTTDAAGHYSLPIADAGTSHSVYWVNTSNTHGFIDQLYQGISCSPTCSLGLGTEIPVPATGSVTADFALVRGGQVRGTVTSASGAIASGTVQLLNASGSVLQSTTTDGVGAYSFSGLLPGSYYVRTSMSALGFIDEIYNDKACINACSTTGATVFVIAAGSVFTANFQLDAGGRISGQVLGEGTALPNYTVQIFPQGSLTTVVSVSTDINGGFTTGGLPAGKYVVRTPAPAANKDYIDQLYAGTPCFPSCNLLSGTPVAVTAGGIAIVPFNLVRGGKISGTVSGPTAATIDLQIGTTTVASVTTTTGAFTFGPLTAGSYFVRTR